MASPSPSPSASAPSSERQTTPILQEFKHLQAVQTIINDQWHTEVQLYENGNDVQATRNHPNAYSTVENETLFPYHSALYPLLDCYDSIRDGQSSSSSSFGGVIRPSPAPMPFHIDGHRRSKFSPRLDRHGVHIEELATLEGNLPNSAWAIRQTLMPRERKVQFVQYKKLLQQQLSSNDDNDGPDNDNDIDLNEQHQGEEPNLNNQDQAPQPPRHLNNTRFWNVLMNPVSENISVASVSDNMSVLPQEESNGEDIGEDGDGWEDNEDWEDIDEKNGQQNIEYGTMVLDAEDMANKAKAARDFAFLNWWQHAIVKERRGIIINDIKASKMSEHVPMEGLSLLEASMPNFSPESLHKSSSAATSILLKVLKHALSDLQREFRLARAALLLVTDWRLCDDGDDQEERSHESGEGTTADKVVGGIEALRRLLTIVSSEYVACGGYCHEWFISQGGMSDNEDEFEDLENSARLDAPNHYCSDWWDFLGSLCTLLTYGITYMTQQHANVICAFVVQEINRASSAAGPITEGVSGSNSEMSSKAYLKQNIYFLNNAEYDAFGRHTEGGLPQDGAGFQLNVNLLLTVLSALRQHAVSDRMRLDKLLGELNGSNTIGEHERGNDDISTQVSKTLKSFQACIEILVDIGERCLLRLPTNNHGRQLGGMIVRALVESYVGYDKFAQLSEKPLSYIAQETSMKLRNVIDPLRYADALASASLNPLLDPSRSFGHNKSSEKSIEQLVGFQPPKDVQDLVKGLFMRDLVDLQVSGCGYGDFLFWCHLPLSPEPLLFDYVSNFPSLGGGGEGEPRNSWAIDEEGTQLDQAYLSARYDFSLLVFLRQWHSPWTPESHLSFSVPYRRAVSTLALCAHRYGVPHDISILVNSFLPRSWWPDDRSCCWCRECQLNKLKNDFQAKIMSRQGDSNWNLEHNKTLTSQLEPEKGVKSPSLISCPGCHVASACSKDHMKYLHQDGHKRYCGLPPFRVPFSDEDNVLCREIFGTKNEEACLLNNEVNEGGGDEKDELSDDGSWESVDSVEEGEEAVRCRSDVIYSFFNDKSYKLQRREAPPFANFF